MSAPANLDSVHADIIDLNELLKLLYDAVGEMPFNRDGVRDPRMDAAYSLARIGKGLSTQVVRSLDAVLTAQAKARGGARAP